MRFSRCMAGVLLASFLGGSCFAQNPASTTTGTGQGLEVEITSPADGTVFGPCDTVLVDAQATLGPTPPTPVNFIYVCDLSGSMETAPFVPGVPDQNGDGVANTKLDALILGLISLNVSLGSASNVDVGLVGFASAAANADVQPAGFFQDFTSPPDADLVGSGPGPDITEVFRSLDSLPTMAGTDGTIGLFLFQTGLGAATNYTAALTAMNNGFATQPGGETNIAFFVSDGMPTTGGSFDAALTAAAAAGTIINTFGVGTGAGGCGAGEPLGEIALATGGSCTIVVDPRDLETALPAAAATRITNLDIKVNGSAAGGTSGSELSSMSISGVDVTSGLVTGSNLLEAVATTQDGSQVTAGIRVTVTADTTPPEVFCPASIEVPPAPGTCSAQVTFMASGDDDCAFDRVECIPASGSMFVAGVTQVCCTAYDQAGNTSRCCFDVTVTDDVPPSVDCPANFTVSTDAGTCTAGVTYMVSGDDNCELDRIDCSPASGTLFGIGVTQVCCTAYDVSGNTSECCFEVTVEDREPPAIHCPSDIVVGQDAGTCAANVTFDVPADDCALARVDCSAASGSSFPIGTTQVCCTAVDASGNSSQCCFNVTVEDREPPVINCPGPIVGISGTPTDFQVEGMDLCGVADVNCFPESGTIFPEGMTTVSCDATDESGNTAQCSFEVTIPVTPPTGGSGSAGSGSAGGGRSRGGSGSR